MAAARGVAGLDRAQLVEKGREAGGLRGGEKRVVAVAPVDIDQPIEPVGEQQERLAAPRGDARRSRNGSLRSAVT